MVCICAWGILVTVFVVGIEWSHWQSFKEIRSRLFKLENKLEHGKERKETKESEASKGERPRS